jgi:hypothetical protein
VKKSGKCNTCTKKFSCGVSPLCKERIGNVSDKHPVSIKALTMGGLKFFPNLPKLHAALLFHLQTVVLALTAMTADESTASKSKRNKLPEKIPLHLTTVIHFSLIKV